VGFAINIQQNTDTISTDSPPCEPTLTVALLIFLIHVLRWGAFAYNWHIFPTAQMSTQLLKQLRQSTDHNQRLDNRLHCRSVDMDAFATCLVML